MRQAIKIIFMGTSIFGLPCLQALIDDKEYEIVAVVTKADKKVGRKQILTPSEIKKLALKHHLTVLQPLDLREIIAPMSGSTIDRGVNRLGSPRLGLAEILNMQPDFIITVAYGQILPLEILKIPKYGAINVHPSLLPKYRGAAPIESALLFGEQITAITFIRMNEKLDSGNILFMEKMPIESSDNAISLRTKLSLLAAKALPAFLRNLIAGKVHETAQNDSAATYCHKIHKNDGLIDLNKLDAKEIFNRVRAFTAWPSCFLMSKGKRLKIIETDIDMTNNASPGTILNLTKNTIGIGTKNGLLIPKKVQLENKRIMTIQEFLAGNRTLLNTLLASPK